MCGNNEFPLELNAPEIGVGKDIVCCQNCKHYARDEQDCFYHFCIESGKTTPEFDYCEDFLEGKDGCD